VVRWTDPAGATHQARVPVPDSLAVGRQVPVWLTVEGQVAAAPTPAATSASNAGFLAVLAWIGSAALIAGASALARRRLDHSDLRRWGQDWLRVEPTWSQR